MMPVLYYSGQESLEILKDTFPDTWEKEIGLAQHRLRIIKKFYKVNTNTAFDKYARYCKDTAKVMLMQAAAYMMQRKEFIGLGMSCLDDNLTGMVTHMESMRKSALMGTNLALQVEHYTKSFDRKRDLIGGLVANIPPVFQYPENFKSKILCT